LAHSTGAHQRLIGGLDAGTVQHRRILVAAAACTVATAVAIDRGGIGAGAAVVVVVALLVFVRVAFRLVDEAERREEERAQGRPRLRGE
jgi:ACR3 family arsenite efflux pump ArsB